MLCRVLLERLPKSVETIYLAVPSLTRDEMLASIAGDLGLDTAGASTHKLMRALQEKLITLHTAGRQVVALIDEAHAMPLATSEEIRLLSNLETGTQKLLQIVLFGQPELDAHLALPNMRQLKERITHSFALEPLPPRDVKDYVNFRLRAAGYRGPDLFGAEALRVITDASEGLTRRINIYADKTLLAAFAAGTHTITADHARAAVSDTQIVMSRRESPRRLALAAAAGLAAGIAIGFALAQFVAPPAPAPVMAMASTATMASASPRLQPVDAALAPVAAHGAGACRSDRRRPLRRARHPRRSERREICRAAHGERCAWPRLPRQLPRRGDARARPRNDLPRVRRQSGGAAATACLYGPFAAKGEASEALASLPATMKQFGPYVRSLEAVREDARRAQRR
jgi:type II secretory pathway predicted ATPase ExeA